MAFTPRDPTVTRIFNSSFSRATFPTGTTVGDLLLVVIATDDYVFDNGGTITAPAGWSTVTATREGANGRYTIAAFSKAADASDVSAGSANFSHTLDTNYNNYAMCWAFADAESTGIIDTVIPGGYDASGPTLTINNIGYAGTGALAIAYFSTRNAAVSYSDTNAWSTSPPHERGSAPNYVEVTGSGTYGSYDITQIGSGHYDGYVFEINATAGGTPHTALPAPGDASGAGEASTAAAGATLTPGAGAAAGAGEAPTVSAGSAVSVSPDSGAAAGAGEAPTVSAGGAVSVSPDPGAAAGAGEAPTAAAGAALTPGDGAAAGAGEAPTVSAGGAVSVSPNPGAAAGAGEAPTAAAGTGVAVTPAPGSAAGVGEAPLAYAEAVVTLASGAASGLGLAPILIIGAPPDARREMTGGSSQGYGIAAAANGAALSGGANQSIVSGDNGAITSPSQNSWRL